MLKQQLVILKQQPVISPHGKQGQIAAVLQVVSMAVQPFGITSYLLCE